MVKYNYDRYSVVTIYADTVIPVEKLYLKLNGVYVTDYFDVGSSYSFDNNTGRYSITSSDKMLNSAEQLDANVTGGYVSGKYAFHPGNGKLYKLSTSTNYSDSYTMYANTTETRQSTISSYQKGTYIDTISAENGAYPDNGKSGSYWYVKQGITNTTPTAPGAFTSPTGTLKGGINITVAYGASTDTEGNAITYETEVSFDNGSTYSVIYGTSSLSFAYSIPKDKDKTQVKFRVRARDASYAYSAYTYSNNFTVLQNSLPTVTLNTTDNRTLYENDTFTIDGQALDTDNGNVVNVKYSIDGVVTKAIVADVSNGTTPLAFNKQLTFKNGKLFDGETALTDTLIEGTAHQLKVWAEDDQGGKSADQIRSFYVVPNRVPALSIDQVTPSGIIDSDKFTITGSCSDPDGNEVAVAYKINGGLSKEIYRGKDSAWNFEVSLKELVVGENAIVVEVTDSYNFKTSKTIKLNKNEVKTPILQSVARYKITPPKSTAKGVLLWIQRDIGLSIDAEISMTLNNEQEQYIAMSKTNTAPINSSIEEDEFTYEASEEKENIIVKLKLTRESTDVSDAITLISGVLS